MNFSTVLVSEIDSQISDGSYEIGEIVHSILQFFPEELGVPFDGEFLRLDQTAPEVLSALRQAVEAAKARLAFEASSWERPTDCERLSAAFMELESLNIATLQNVGFTNDMARAEAWSLVVALERVGHASVGFCCFHQQDVMHALSGSGLSIGFGANPPGEEDSLLARCGAIAGVVVTALEKAGLEVVWADPRQRINLPNFRWQHPGRSAWRIWGLRDPADGVAIEPLIASLQAEIRGCGVDEMVLERRFDDYFGSECWGQDLTTQRERFEAEVSAFIESQRQAESQWKEPTDNDRLDAALRQLEGAGRVLTGDLGTTIEDGWAYVKSTKSPEHRGAVFFHQQDVIGAMRGDGLRLAFGAWGDGAVDVEESVELAQLACDAFRANGLQPEWDESYRHRISIPVFTWQKRRWSVAPSVRVTLPSKFRNLSKLFGKRRESVDFMPHTLGAHLPGRTERHVAHRDVGAYNLGLFARMRRIGEQLGVQHGHPSNLGKPYCWLRTGEVATFMVRSADENLPAAMVSEVYFSDS